MRQRGNILFLILLAVILFAALSYAVTSSLRGGGKDASVETVKAGAAAILQFIGQMDAALLRMQLAGNIMPENISFEYIVTIGTGVSFNGSINANCTSDACRLFKPSGGGVSPIIFSKYSAADPTGWDPTWAKPGYYDFYMMQWPYAGTDANDIILRILAIDPLVCNEIRASLDMPSTIGMGGGYVAANTPANWDNAGLTCSSNCSVLLGKSTFTTGQTTSGGGNYCIVWHLLIAR